MAKQRLSLLSSQARVQVPFVKVTIGDFTFGVYSRTDAPTKDKQGVYINYNIQYPNYIQSLTITKINGQVNQYTLNIKYPVRQTDDPNFFEKVFSSVSGTRKIIFSYGDTSMPTYIYKDEEAIITGITQTFDLNSSVISYTINAVSGAALKAAGNCNFLADNSLVKPSDKIKEIFRNKKYGLQDIFTGMKVTDLDKFIAGDDKRVRLETKLNISALDYILYLASCMMPAGSPEADISKDIYIMTIYDDSSLVNMTNAANANGGPYFLVTKTSYATERAEAYEIDIGYNTSTIVTNFSIEQNENYSLYYDYQKKLYPEEYVRRLDNNGNWVDVLASSPTSKNDNFETDINNITWWTKITKYPINATVTIQGLLRPATLMSYVRLNVIFPGGHKHISSGLYIITKQQDQIDFNGYRTTLSLTKIAGDSSIKIGK